jgi:hypothetical protein
LPAATQRGSLPAERRAHTEAFSAVIRLWPLKSRGLPPVISASRASLPMEPPLAYLVPTPVQSLTVLPEGSLPLRSRNVTMPMSAESWSPVAASAKAVSSVSP